MKTPFKILVLSNRLRIDIKDDFAKFKQWVEERVPYEITFDFRSTDLNLSHTSFGIRRMVGGVPTEMYGLNGVKEQLRALGTIPDYWYHSVIFLYDLNDTGFDLMKKSLGNWTYFSQVVPGTEFTEVVTDPNWDKGNDVFRVITHEIIHAWHFRARRLGIPTNDTLDLYDKEFDPMATDGNRARNIKELTPHWEKIAVQPELNSFLYLFGSQISMIALQVKRIFMPEEKLPPVAQPPKQPSRIELWAEAIKSFEGWFVGSRSHRNFNPGNIKFIGQKLAIGKDDKGFAIFPTYKAGWDTLTGMLTRAASGLSAVYKPTMTLAQFFSVYAPASDSNNPNKYAEFVAAKIGVPATTQIKDLV